MEDINTEEEELQDRSPARPLQYISIKAWHLSLETVSRIASSLIQCSPWKYNPVEVIQAALPHKKKVDVWQVQNKLHGKALNVLEAS